MNRRGNRFGALHRFAQSLGVGPELDETIETISMAKLAEMKESTKHLEIRASIVGVHLHDSRLVVIDVGNSTTGSRFSVPKDKARALVAAMNQVLL